MNGPCGKTTGERVRALRKRYGYKNETLGEILGLEPNSVSRCIREKFSDEAINKLADLFHVQPEFLRCETDYETVGEMYEAVAAQNIKGQKATLDYLKSLGLNIVPKTYFIGTHGDLYLAYFDIEDYLTNAVKEKLPEYACIPSHDEYKHLLESKTPSTQALPHCDALYTALLEKAKEIYDTDFEETFYLELTGNPYSNFLAKADALKKGDIPTEAELKEELAPEAVDKTRENIDNEKNLTIVKNRSAGLLGIMYHVSFKNKYLGIYKRENLDRLIETLDSLCLTTIEHILTSKDPLIKCDVEELRWSGWRSIIL